MNAQPTLAELLAPCCQAEIARRIGRPRAFVWRLAMGGPLTDASVIPALAQALHQPEELLRNIIHADLRTHIARNQSENRRAPRGARRTLHAIERFGGGLERAS